MLTPLFGVQESFSERVVFDLQSCYLPREKKQTKNKQLKSKYIKKKCFWLKEETKDVPSTVSSKIDLCNSRPTAPLHDYPAAAAVFLTNTTIHQLYFLLKERKSCVCVSACVRV